MRTAIFLAASAISTAISPHWLANYCPDDTPIYAIAFFCFIIMDVLEFFKKMDK